MRNLLENKIWNKLVDLSFYCRCCTAIHRVCLPTNRQMIQKKISSLINSNSFVHVAVFVSAGRQWQQTMQSTCFLCVSMLLIIQFFYSYIICTTRKLKGRIWMHNGQFEALWMALMSEYMYSRVSIIIATLTLVHSSTPRRSPPKWLMPIAFYALCKQQLDGCCEISANLKIHNSAMSCWLAFIIGRTNGIDNAKKERERRAREEDNPHENRLSWACSDHDVNTPTTIVLQVF